MQNHSETDKHISQDLFNGMGSSVAFIAGDRPLSPTAAFYAGWNSKPLYTEAECKAMEERWELEDQQNRQAAAGAYDDQAVSEPDGYTDEDLRLELVNATMSAGKW